MDNLNPYASPNPSEADLRPTTDLSPPQRVSLQLTEDEALLVSEHLTATNQALRKFIRQRQTRHLISAAVLAAGCAMVAVGDSLSNPICIIGGVYSALLVLAAIRLPERSRQANAQVSRDMLADDASTSLDAHSVTLEADGFRVENENGHSFRKWKATPKVEQTNGMLLLYSSTFSAHAVPSRAFFNEAAYEAFCHLAQRLWQDAHKGETADDVSPGA